MFLFYDNTISESLKSGFHTLSKEESKHIVKVLRKQEGDIIHFTDGKGMFYETKIILSSPSACQVEIIKNYPGDDERSYHLHLAIAPTKNNDRLEWFLEKTTEIGIDEITPIICQQSERKVVKYDRLNKVITAAVKQSLKSRHPKLNEQSTFKEFVSQPFNGMKFIAYIDDDVNLELSSAYKAGENSLILIGPEGDFRKEEVDLAMQNGFIPVSLGKSRLRTETAGIVACHTINLINSIG